MLSRIESQINCINEFIGRSVSWLVSAMVAITFFIVIMRYGFNFGTIAVQESVIYLHSIVFMLAIAYTYKHNAHVRVDIFYASFNERKKAWVDFFGTLFLLVPLCLYLIFSSWEYASKSWLLLEGSREAGGLPLVFILKSLIPLMPALLLLQAFATICHCLQVFRTKQNNLTNG